MLIVSGQPDGVLESDGLMKGVFAATKLGVRVDCLALGSEPAPTLEQLASAG